MSALNILFSMTEAQTKVFAAVAANEKDTVLGYLVRELKDITGMSARKTENAVKELLRDGILALDGRVALQQGVELSRDGLVILGSIESALNGSN